MKSSLNRLVGKYNIGADDMTSMSKYASEKAAYARGGRVGYAEGGEAERPERSSPEPLTSEQARQFGVLMSRYLPPATFGPQLATAQQSARSETEAFSNMIRQMAERAESPTSRAEMYFRLASAFGAPTKTGQFTENLALAGKEMGEVAKGRRADEAERRALNLRAQEMKMTGARQDLATLQALAGQEAAERRAIATKVIEAQVRANTPGARDRRIADMMATYNIDRATAAGIVDGIESVVVDPVTGIPHFVNRITGESRPAGRGAATGATSGTSQGTSQGTTPGATPSAAPGTTPGTPPGSSPAPAPGTTPTVPRSPTGRESAQPARSLFELASVPRTTGVLPAIGEMVQGVAGQVGVNVVPPELTERRQVFRNVQNEIIKAVINNPRFPVAEQERIRREINIEPGAFTDPQTFLARIRTLDGTLRTNLVNRENEAQDTSLPVAERQASLKAANDIRNILAMLGVPQGGEEPAPAPRPQRRDTRQPSRAPQQGGWSIQPVD